MKSGFDRLPPPSLHHNEPPCRIITENVFLGPGNPNMHVTPSGLHPEHGRVHKKGPIVIASRYCGTYRTFIAFRGLMLSAQVTQRIFPHSELCVIPTFISSLIAEVRGNKMKYAWGEIAVFERIHPSASARLPRRSSATIAYALYISARQYHPSKSHFVRYSIPRTLSSRL